MALEAERIQNEIQRVIGDDPTIQEANRILISVEKTGFMGLGKATVFLRGSVHSESDRKKAEKTASLHCGGLRVVDDIRIVH